MVKTLELCEHCEERKTEVLKAPNGMMLCEECEDEYEFTCCLCENLEWDSFQDEAGCLLVVRDGETRWFYGGNVAPGVYEIVKHPYYGGPLIGEGYLFDNALEWLAPLPPDYQTAPYPCGHLCRRCTQKVRDYAVEMCRDG